MSVDQADRIAEVVGCAVAAVLILAATVAAVVAWVW